MQSKVRNLAIATVIALAITSLSACGGKDTVAETSSNGLPAVTANAGEAPTITAPTGAAPSEVGRPDMNPTDKSNHATKKFIATPANKTAACIYLGLFTKLLLLSGPVKDSSSGFSPKILT
jgi:hypothetical protein